MDWDGDLRRDSQKKEKHRGVSDIGGKPGALQNLKVILDLKLFSVCVYGSFNPAHGLTVIIYFYINALVFLI